MGPHIGTVSTGNTCNFAEILSIVAGIHSCCTPAPDPRDEGQLVAARGSHGRARRRCIFGPTGIRQFNCSFAGNSALSPKLEH